MKVGFSLLKFTFNPPQKIGKFITNDVDSNHLISFRKIEYEDLKYNKCYPVILINYEKSIQIKFNVGQKRFGVRKGGI
ncbi:MAG: hypothetical protein WHV28_09625 [Bacteroidota bacterium]